MALKQRGEIPAVVERAADKTAQQLLGDHDNPHRQAGVPSLVAREHWPVVSEHVDEPVAVASFDGEEVLAYAVPDDAWNVLTETLSDSETLFARGAQLSAAVTIIEKDDDALDDAERAVTVQNPLVIISPY